MTLHSRAIPRLPRTVVAAPRPCRASSTAQGNETPTSLVPQTLEGMRSDPEYQELLRRSRHEKQDRKAERAARQRSLEGLATQSFQQVMRAHSVTPLKRASATILQLNVGLYCNQACAHCHVESSPLRTEMMDHASAARCIEILRASPSIRTLDLTGGAPELNGEFTYLVREARALGVEVIDRCNLTVLLEPGQEHLAEFLADNQVRVVASLPCYTQETVDKQRGGGVFQRSIQGLQLLNAAGYGRPGSGLTLDLVYNPAGSFLAPSQKQLQPLYKTELEEAYGIVFNSLLCLNNMPIKRFVDHLQKERSLDKYMQLLVDNFNPAAGEAVMCRDTVSVAWDGRLYDCDFNQQLALPMAGAPAGRSSVSIWDIASTDELTGRLIACDNHCFGCTAGAGSSCQGQ